MQRGLCSGGRDLLLFDTQTVLDSLHLLLTFCEEAGLEIGECFVRVGLN